jgi:uncharacterized protein (TIGR02246 family)
VTTSPVDTAVRDLYARLLESWNRRDAEGYATLFAEDAALIGFDGSQAAGAEILDHLTPIFADHPTAAYVSKVRGVRPLGPDAAVLRAIAGMVPPGQRELNPDLNAVQSLVAQQHAGSWRIVLFQNTPAQYHGRPELAEQHTAELRQLPPSQQPTG